MIAELRWEKVKPNKISELAGVFLKLGVMSFGGPAVHIAMMEEEVVAKRKWMSRDHFLDLVGATNLIPGPNSTEMTMHVGYTRAGLLGLIVAGGCFILPAVLITAIFAWLYMGYGSLPDVAPFLIGIRPAVLAVIFTAIWRLGKTAAKSIQILLIGLLAMGVSFLGVNEVVVLLGGGIVGMMWLGYLKRNTPSGGKKIPIVLALLSGMIPKSAKAIGLVVLPLVVISATGVDVSLWKLGLFFLKIGSVLYGSGYVLIAFLEGGLVHEYGWLTQKQLLDAVAVGQFTPGPVLSTATFVGYVVSGLPGALVATAAIFLPSFIFVAILNPQVPKLRKSIWTSGFLDAVNICSIGLMMVVAIKLSYSTLVNWQAVVIALIAIGVGLKWKINTFLLVVGGGVLGWILHFVSF